MLAKSNLLPFILFIKDFYFYIFCMATGHIFDFEALYFPYNFHVHEKYRLWSQYNNILFIISFKGFTMK